MSLGIFSDSILMGSAELISFGAYYFSELGLLVLYLFIACVSYFLGYRMAAQEGAHALGRMFTYLLAHMSESAAQELLGAMKRYKNEEEV